MNLKNLLEKAQQAADMQERVCETYRHMLNELILQRDELFALCRKWEVPTPEAVCRNCDAQMHMAKWEDQFCSTCKGE